MEQVRRYVLKKFFNSRENKLRTQIAWMGRIANLYLMVSQNLQTPVWQRKGERFDVWKQHLLLSSYYTISEVWTACSVLPVAECKATMTWKTMLVQTLLQYTQDQCGIIVATAETSKRKQQRWAVTCIGLSLVSNLVLRSMLSSLKKTTDQQYHWIGRAIDQLHLCQWTLASGGCFPGDETVVKFHITNSKRREKPLSTKMLINKCKIYKSRGCPGLLPLLSMLMPVSCFVKRHCDPMVTSTWPNSHN